MNSKLGRNKPCWCGSGVKFKKCHLDRDKDEPLNPWEAETILKRNFSKKYCSVPTQLKHECEGNIIRAHTVGKSGSLSKITRDGHVYSYKVNFKSLNENQGTLRPQLTGINLASTFTGFCSKHDKEIFLSVDNHPFIGTSKQCFLLAYRAISRECFTKTSLAETLPLYHQTDRGRNISTQQYIQEITSSLGLGVEAGLRDIFSEKKRFDEILIKKDYESVKFYILKTQIPPEIMGCGGFTPDYDFNGNQIQDLMDLESKMDILTFSSIATDKGGAIIFTWHKDSSESCYKFIQSLHKISNSDLPNHVVNFFFNSCENIFFNPDWWDNLSKEKQLTLNEMILVGVHPNRPIEDNRFIGNCQEYVNWTITERVTNCREL